MQDAGAACERERDEGDPVDRRAEVEVARRARRRRRRAWRPSRGRERRRGARDGSCLSSSSMAPEHAPAARRAAIRDRPERVRRRLREEVHVRVDRLALARRRLALGRAEVEQAEDALAARDADRLAAPARAQHAGRAPVARQSALGRGEQDELDRRRRRADVLLVLDEVAAERGRGDDERRRAVELRGLLLARDLLERRERLRARARGSATAASCGASARAPRPRAARAASPARRARSRTSCGCGAPRRGLRSVTRDGR